MLHVHRRGTPPAEAVEVLGTDHADARKPRVGDTLRATLSPDDGRVIGVWTPMKSKRGARGTGRLFFLDRAGKEAVERLAERRGLRAGQVLAQLAFAADLEDRMAELGSERLHAAVEARRDVLRELE